LRCGGELLIAVLIAAVAPAIVSLFRARDWLAPFRLDWFKLAVGLGALSAFYVGPLSLAWLVVYRTNSVRYWNAARCAACGIVAFVCYYTWRAFSSQEALTWSVLGVLYIVPGALAVVLVCLAAAWWTKFDGDAP
jgi:hypothetical protein